jgi:hypothetical protein
LGLLLDISRRNLDRVLYFAQYIVTYVDEDARTKALKRLEDEISVSEREAGSQINSKFWKSSSIAIAVWKNCRTSAMTFSRAPMSRSPTGLSP